MFSHGLYSSLCSPTEFTEYTEPSCRIFSHRLHSSCSMFSHGIHGIHRTSLLYVLPQIAQIFTDRFFQGVYFLLCWCT